MTADTDQQVIDEFRANHGRVGGVYANSRLLLLTTTGARTGEPHTTPLYYLPDEGERVLVIASAEGAPRHPDWYHNLLANPRVTVEDGLFTYDAHAVVIRGAERDRLFARAAEAEPRWAEYQAKTARALPVVALERIDGGAPNARSYGEGLKMIHDAFRRELALIRHEVATSGPTVGAQLRVNCLTVCGGLHHHHTLEDTGMFPGIEESRPDLASALAQLRREHEVIAALVDNLQEIIAAPQADPQQVLPDVDRLISELESHLSYEEEQLIPVLDATTE